MRCLVIIFPLLAYSIAIADENPERSRRHLQFVKDLFITKLFGAHPTGNVKTSLGYNIETPIGRKVENSTPLLEAKVLDIPGNNLQDEAKIEMVETYLGTTNHEETLETLKHMKSLLETGILNVPTYTYAHSGYDAEILQPPYPSSSSLGEIRKPLAPPLQFEHSGYGSLDFSNKNIDQIPEASTTTKLDPRSEAVIVHPPITPIVVDFTKFPTTPTRASDRYFGPEPVNSVPVYHHYHHYHKPGFHSHYNRFMFKPAPSPLSHFKSNKFQMFSIPFGIFAPIPNFSLPSGIMIQKTVPYETTIGHHEMPITQYPFKPDSFGTFGLNNNYGFSAPAPYLYNKPGFYFDSVDEADYLKNNPGYASYIASQAPAYTAPPATEEPFTGYHYGPSAAPVENNNKQKPDNNPKDYVYLPPHYVCKSSLNMCKVPSDNEHITDNLPTVVPRNKENGNDIDTSIINISQSIPDKLPTVVPSNKENSNGIDTSTVNISQSIPNVIAQSEPNTELPPTAPEKLTVLLPTDGTTDIKVQKINDSTNSNDDTKIIINERPTEPASTTELKPTEVPSTITPVESTTISIIIGKPPDQDTKVDIPA